MRDFKFDMDIILQNCERFGIKVEKRPEQGSVTMNGQMFDVAEEMERALKALEEEQIDTFSYAVEGVKKAEYAFSETGEKAESKIKIETNNSILIAA